MSSLTIMDTTLTIQADTLTASIPFEITDDQVGLEDPEEVTLTLSVASSECSNIQISNTMQLVVLDDNGELHCVLIRIHMRLLLYYD